MARGFLLIATLLCLTAVGWTVTKDEAALAAYREIVPQVSEEILTNHFRRISSYGSRLPGSQGELRTFDYVEAELRRLGAKNVRREPFKVTVPDPDARGELQIGETRIPVLPLWPNLARTSTCDLKGRLIYGGDGSMEALSGHAVQGSIVLLEFTSGARWRNAAKLGALGIIFIEPDHYSRSDAETKFSSVPLDVPRFFLRLRDVGPALNAARSGAQAELKCRQDWVERTSYNLYADIPGNVQSEKVVLLANADAMSVVPALTPGAEEISGPAGLLEVARIWSRRAHRRPLTLALSGAHTLALQGAREYVEKRFGNEPVFLTLTLDLSSGSRVFGSYGRGWFYEYRDEPLEKVKSVSRNLRAHADRLATIFGVPSGRFVLVDAVNSSDNRSWKNNIPGRFALDCEPILNSGMNALTLRTIEDGRDLVDTPANTLERVDLANVHRQVQTIAAMLHHILNDTSSASDTSGHSVPLKPQQPQRISLIGGFGVLEGNVVIYDPVQSFVPDVKVPGSLAAVLGLQKTMMGVRGDMLQLTQGEEAQYRFIGVTPTTAYWWAILKETHVAAFHLDPQTGKIDHAPSLGIYGDFSYPIDFELKTGRRQSPIVVFPCVAINLFGLVDPQDLRAIERLEVLDAATDSWPQDFGLFSPNFDQRLSPEIEDAQVLFLPPGSRFKLLGGSAIGELRLILTNSTVGDEAGKGYGAPGGESTDGRGGSAKSGSFLALALNAARDIANINRTRLEQFRKYRIISSGLFDLQGTAESEIEAAEEALQQKDWANADRHARSAWGYALRAHPVIQKTANDVVNGVVFYLFLIIPFSYFLERLLFGHQLLTKQLAISISIFVGSFILLRLIHPAFEIVSNPTMIFVAFVMGALSLIVITFILGKFETSLKAVRQAQSGVHEVDIRRSSVTLAAFNLGVSNMRRRKARTILTTLTLVVMTFIVLSFTSIVSELQLNELPSDNVARYSGLLIRNAGLDPLQLTTYRQVAAEFSQDASVVRRAYYYGADVDNQGVLTLQRADRAVDVRAMVGMDSAEAEVLRPQEALVPGGRWFKEGERDVMILPTPLAESLRIDASEIGKASVRYAGKDFTVIGIIDPSILRALLDLDGDGVMPPDFSLTRQYQEAEGQTNQAFRNFIRFDPGVCFIVPAQTALELGADLRTVAVRFENPEATREALDELMPRLRLNLYASVPGEGGLEVRQFSVFQGSKGTGIGLIIVQLIIAAVFVLNTMIASVYERTREISIFSAIGLAPNHIAMLFFAESLVYGILGAVFGYFGAQATAKVIVATGALPGLTLNFSSTSAVLSAGLVLAVVLLSTIYPAKKAAEIAAPAMNEEVFETEPEGDVWELPLPFSISAAEAPPLVEFLTEWLKAYEGYTIGEFVTSGTTLAMSERDPKVFTIQTTAWLAPYDLGISQQFKLVVQPSIVPGVYQLDLRMVRLSGDPENWPVVNRRFLENLRKQFLTWRTLDRQVREKYIRGAGGELSERSPSPAL